MATAPPLRPYSLIHEAGIVLRVVIKAVRGFTNLGNECDLSPVFVYFQHLSIIITYLVQSDIQPIRL